MTNHINDNSVQLIDNKKNDVIIITYSDCCGNRLEKFSEYTEYVKKHIIPEI